jgi:UDP-N-acetylmuramate dehydrogenase
MIEKNKSLKLHNTFGVDANARYFAKIHHVNDLIALQDFVTPCHPPPLILGGGSNILFTKDFDGLVIHNQIFGIEKINEDAEYVYLKVGSGENWHQFVLYCVEKNYAGIENLSLIPGTVGAAPVQNIGAYGVELKDAVFEVHTVALHEQTLHVFNQHDCAFGYRDSIFKQSLKNKHIITHVVFRLNKNPQFHTDYSDIKQRLNDSELSIRKISDIIIQVRQEKLPNPAVIGNAGSFFKNPLVPEDFFLKLQTQYPQLPHFPEKNQQVKIPAAWLIDQCGFKGKRFGNVGIYANQALVLINYGNATGEQIKILSEQIQKTVKDTFAIDLTTEVHIF